MATSHDLNLRLTSNSPNDSTQDLISLCKCAHRLGHRVVAISNYVEDIKDTTSKKGKQNKAGIMSAGEFLTDETLQKIKAIDKDLKVYTRFTAVTGDTAQVYKFQTSKEIKTYDIIAVQPTTEKSFAQACSTLDIDIICVDLTERLPYHFKRPTINTAIERGIFFEINYSPALQDSSARRQLISNAYSLISVTKGKNIILSSQAVNPMDIRGTADVANLGVLFGMNPAQAKDTVTMNGRAVLFHSKTRKSANAVVSISKEPCVNETDHTGGHRSSMARNLQAMIRKEKEKMEKSDSNLKSDSDSLKRSLNVNCEVQDHPKKKKRKRKH